MTGLQRRLSYCSPCLDQCSHTFRHNFRDTGHCFRVSGSCSEFTGASRNFRERCGSFLLWFLTFLSHRVLADELVDGYLGENVLLPCTARLSNTALPTVYWRIENNGNVYDVIEGADNLQNQDPQFKGRTSVFPAEYSKGNFSLFLTDLSSTDAGLYTCFIIGQNIQHNVKLQVKAKPTTDIRILGDSDSTEDRTPKTALVLLSLLGSVFPHLYR